MPAKAEKPIPKPIEKKSPPKCEDCCNKDSERKDKGFAYCKYLQRWSDENTPTCGGKFFGKSPDVVKAEKLARLKALEDAKKAEPAEEKFEVPDA